MKSAHVNDDKRLQKPVPMFSIKIIFQKTRHCNPSHVIESKLDASLNLNANYLSNKTWTMFLRCYCVACFPAKRSINWTTCALHQNRRHN